MEKNQQQNGERNTSFNNRQMGQQMGDRDGAAANSVETNPAEVQDFERHSEGSEPDAENETLGTP